MKHDPTLTHASHDKSPHPGRILIVGPSWIGDMVMAQSLFITLDQLHPGVAIDVLAPGWSRPLLERMPQVTEAIDMPVGHGVLGIGKRRELGRMLQSRRYEQAIVLPNSFKSALIPWFAGIALRTGWRGEMRYGLLNDLRHPGKRKYPLLVQRFNALAYPPGRYPVDEQPAPLLRTDGRHVGPLLERFSLDTHRGILVLCPGAEFGPAKRWPARHYAAVAKDRIHAGWQVWLMGSEKDRGIAQEIAGALTGKAQSHCKILAGRTTLEQAIDLMALARAVVSNDSGLMHVAAALGRPLVALYGSTSPDFTPPLHEGATVLSSPVDCGPCFRRECPKGYLKCLEEISPDRVLGALGIYPGSSRGKAGS